MLGENLKARLLILPSL